MSSDLPEPWREFPGVGPKLAERLAALGITRPEGLLTHLPLRYEDRTRITALGDLRPGTNAQVVGEAQSVQIVAGRRPMLVVLLADESGFVCLRFFHFTSRMRQAFRRGAHYLCFGEVRAGTNGLELVHPGFRAVPRGRPVAVESRLTPVYPAAAGITQFQLRRCVESAFAALDAGRLAGYALASVQNGWPDLREALERIHFPPPEAGTPQTDDPALMRLAFDELLAHHLALRASRASRARESAPDLSVGARLAARMRAALPFALTEAQGRSVKEITADLAGPRPMRRLLQGDVGSGKTAVAALAAAQAIGAGFQVAFMAPTELLAEQHLRSLAPWCRETGIESGLLTASTPAADRKRLRKRIQAGEPWLLVGTHALITEGAALPRLGLAIVDEQHRFGVGQRLALSSGSDRFSPHQLVMTATPIPRTLAMTLYADLDVSTLDELPPGRRPVTTAVMNEERRAELVKRIGALVAAGQQAYWVCPLIEESEVLAAEAAEKTAEALAAALPDVEVALVHGRLKETEKNEIMRRFMAGAIGLLVATTVIEVGVDVPNASLMVVENAERLGLAQLHQLRGRVGRGEVASHCVLLYRGPLSARARERLAALRSTTDGFRIAETDLKLRGPGELVGKRQAGLAQLRVADLVRDRDLLAKVAPVAGKLAGTQPETCAALVRFWLGEAVRYAKA
ncbi:MAG: ATP-dependent DNA helicase RecG [Gammaproteobacteria bacterium]|nr:ATP-dependent DNA helicase RecG [Gammaproteobacteria bacterium]